MTISPEVDAVATLKSAHRTVWASGDYASVAEHIAEGPPTAVVTAAGVHAGDRVLDVAAGSGNVALVAARRGARVTGLDLVPELLDVARERAAAESLDVELVTGDAEALPFADGSFDRVLSVFGVQFAPRHAVTAAELARVTAPGGTISVANWTPDGLIGRVLKTVGGYMPKPPAFASPPPLWGDEDHVRELFAGHGVELGFELMTTPWRFASAEAFMVLFEERYGPVIKARERLTAEGTWDSCRADILDVLAAFDQSGNGTYEGHAAYLVATARRV